MSEPLPSKERFDEILNQELAQFSCGDREYVDSTLIPIVPKTLKWEYGDFEPFQAWVFADFKERNVGAAYCLGGHGALGSPWGLIFFEDENFGMDCGWYRSLADLFDDWFA